MTSIVSARVNSDTALKVSRIIRQQGSSVTEVIQTVWNNILITGELPERVNGDDKPRNKMDEFIEFLESVDFKGALTDEEVDRILSERVKDYEEL